MLSICIRLVLLEFHALGPQMFKCSLGWITTYKYLFFVEIFRSIFHLLRIWPYVYAILKISSSHTWIVVSIMSTYHAYPRMSCKLYKHLLKFFLNLLAFQMTQIYHCSVYKLARRNDKSFANNIKFGIIQHLIWSKL